jgi:carbon-monoxide dehydrogenase small subunit
MNVSISINGGQVTREIEPRQLLVHFIRETPGLTGTHWGCDTSNCGACVVQMDGEPVKSCTILTSRSKSTDSWTRFSWASTRPTLCSAVSARRGC